MKTPDLSRRMFLAGATALLALAGCATMPAGTDAPARQSVSISTPDGNAGALLFTPKGAGPWPAIIVYPDVSGLRPVFADIGGRLAREGYVVLVPNPFYRSIALDGSAETAAPLLDGSATFRRGQEWRALATDEKVMADARAFAEWLANRPGVEAGAPMGVAGYDIGAAHAFLAARALPTRIAAVGVAHPSAIATTRDNSPHLFVSESRAEYLVQIAAPDDEREPQDKDDLRAAFDGAGLPAVVSVVAADHGYAVPDQAGYDSSAEAGFFSAMLSLFARRLD